MCNAVCNGRATVKHTLVSQSCGRLYIEDLYLEHTLDSQSDLRYSEIVVRNEKNSRGDSIAERYGPPVTASDVEDLMYRERVPAASIYKIMQAVRAALSWGRSSSVRPWAGDLEDGLTRQEERRADERRARLAEALRDEGRQRAAAAEAEAARVNSPNPDPKEALGEALADAWATAAQASDAAAPGRPLGATLSVVQGGAGTITPTALPEPPRAIPAPRDAEIILPTIMPRAGGWLGINRELFREPAQPAGAAPPSDAPASPLAATQAVADPAPAPVPPPAPPEAATGLSEAQPRKRCTKCGQMKALDDFQKDKRASDERRPSCKICSSHYDALRRSLKKSLHASTESAVDEAVDAMQEADGETVLRDLRDFQVKMGVITPEKAEELAVPTARQDAGDDLDAVFAEFRPLAGLPPDTRNDVVVLIPKFDPPDVDEELEEDDGLRECRSCHVRKPESGYYSRSDGRLRFACRECEKTASRNAKLKRTAGA